MATRACVDRPVGRQGPRYPEIYHEFKLCQVSAVVAMAISYNWLICGIIMDYTFIYILKMGFGQHL